MAAPTERPFGTTQRRVLTVMCLFLGLFVPFLSLASSAPALTGGPDSFGYRFIDSNSPGGPTGGAPSIVGAGGTDIGNHCEDCVTPLTLPFPIDFYSLVGVNNVNVNSNGV